MRAFLSLILIVCIALLVLSPAKAQDFDAPTESYMADPYYRLLVRQAIFLQPDDFQFHLLRGLYSLTPHYDPVGAETLDRMMSLAFIVDTKPESDEAQRAFSDYEALLHAHLGNLDIMRQALSLAVQNRVFGDPKKLRWIYEGLRSHVLLSGTGDSLSNAYFVVTLGEELMVLQHIGGKITETLLQESGGIYYNIHDLKFEDGSKRSVFVDVTKPMLYLHEKSQREGGRALAIPRQ